MNLSMHLTTWLDKAADEHPRQLAAICGARRTNYVELQDRARRLAAGLKDLGVAAGDRVVIIGLDSDRYLEFYFGCWYADAIITPVNHRWSIDEIAFSLDDCEASVLVVDDPFCEQIAALKAKLKNMPAVVYIGDATGPAERTLYADLLKCEPAQSPALSDKSAAALFYTGGTTGRSKGVLLSHCGVFINTLASLPLCQRNFGATCIHGLPMFHAGGLYVTLQAVACHSTLVALPAFDPANLLDLVEREQISEVALVPTMIRFLLDHPKFSAERLRTVRRLLYGASPIDGSLLTRLADLLPNCLLLQQYGMTETGGIVSTLPDWCHRGDSQAKGYHRGAGLTTPGAQVEIQAADGAALPNGHIGEICIRSPGVMMKYWGLPEATAQALRDGWMHTGDMGYRDDQGILYIVDRLKDMIISGGENVYSAEVEDAILSMPTVAQCAVIAVPDQKWGERVHAVVVPAAGASLTEQEIFDHCRQRIAGFKCPRSVECRDALPVSGAGKILKFKLREPHWSRQSANVS